MLNRDLSILSVWGLLVWQEKLLQTLAYLGWSYTSMYAAEEECTLV